MTATLVETACPECGHELTRYPAGNHYCPKKKGGCGRTFTSLLREVGKNACRLCDAPTNTVHCRSCSKWVSACRRDGCEEEWVHVHVVIKVCAYVTCTRQFLTRDLGDPSRERAYCSERCNRNEHQRRYDQRKRMAPRSISKKKRERAGRVTFDLLTLTLLVEQDYKCSGCGELIDLTLRHQDAMALTADHTIALANGGSDDRQNLTAMHRRCNSSKRDREAA